MDRIIFFQRIYDSILLLAFLSVIYRFSVLDKASRIFSVYVWSATLCELIGFYAAKKYSNNLPVYGIGCLVEFGLICLYFNNSIDVFRKRNIGYYIGVIGIVWGIINLAFIQGLYTLNSYFLVFEGICIIGMALFSFFRLLLHYDTLRLHKYHHFWLAAILIFFWSATFINWSLYDYFFVRFKNMTWTIDLSIVFAGIITYMGIACVFILYPKMQKTYE